MARYRAAQIIRQRAPHAHGEHAGLFQPVVLHAGNIAGRENKRIGDRLQAVVHQDKTFAVERQTGIAQPGRPTRARDPDNLVRVHPSALGGVQTRPRDLVHRRTPVHLYIARLQHRIEAAPHPCVVGRQDIRVGGKQVKCQFARIATEQTQLVAQAVLHGQRQFHAARATAHHRDGGGAGMQPHALQQGQPALVELEDRLDRYRVFPRARHLVPLRGRADVDNQPVIGDGRPAAHHHPARRTVDARDFSGYETRARKHREPPQVDVHFVKPVVARNITRQHARVGCVYVGADQRKAHARHRLHAKVPEQHDMAVPAAHQNYVAQYRLFQALRQTRP